MIYPDKQQYRLGTDIGITFLTKKETTNNAIYPNRYEFDSTKSHKWLQKICFWILSKIMLPVMESIVSVEYVPFPPQGTLLDKILAARSEARYSVTNGAISLKLYIGTKQAAELMEDSHFNLIYKLIEIRDTLPMETGRHRIKTKEFVLDMSMFIVPWMDGILVVPDVDKMGY